MSGITGTPRIKRKDFDNNLKTYRKLLKHELNLPISRILPTGSYISRPNKQDFGDMDLIIEFQGISDKKVAKQLLINNKDNFLPFVSNEERKYYNAGELVTFNYDNCQVDNIISLSPEETNFKLKFLNLSAETQGLLLGFIKISIQEKGLIVLDKLGINYEPTNKILEFNLSSKELQLREIEYHDNSFKEKTRKIIWTSQNWSDVETIVSLFKVKMEYKDLLSKAKTLSDRSKRRIKGIFNSMITVKLGEVGTEKGRNKELKRLEVSGI